LEQPPEQSPGATDARPQTLVLSAVDPASLDIVTERMAERLSGGSFGDQDLADIAWTLQAGRRALPHRLAVSAGSLEEAVTKLRKSSGRGLYRGRVTGAPGAVAFLLPGQGSQRPGMSRDLAAFDAGFAEDLAWASKLLAPRLGRDLSVLLLADPDDQAAAERLRDTALAQPALFAHHYAAARFWMRLGVRPAALLGHSIGELTAACLAGVMRPEDGLMLAAERGRLMAAAKPGVMLAVPLSEADTTALMGSALDLCAVNGPQRCVVGGPESAIADLEKTLAQRGTPGRRLVTSHAFHSRSMDPVLEDFRKAVAAMSLTPPSLPVLSNRTGKPLSAAEATDPSYWVDHLRHAVRFADGLAGLEGAVGAAPLLFDLGPGPGLTALAKGSEVLSGAAPAEALAGLWARGQEIEWRAVKGEHHRRRLRLPLTPFRRQKHWIDPPSRDARTAAGAVAVAAQPSEGTLAPKQRLAQPVWRRLAVVGRKAVAPTQSLRILSGQSKTAKAIAKALAALVPQQEDGAALLVDLRPMDLAEGVAKTRPAWDPEAQSMAFDGPAALMAAADPSPVVVVLPDDPAAAALALGPVLARPFEQAGSKAAALSLSAKDRKDPALVARAICTLLQDDAPIGALRLSGGWLEAAALETLPLPDADSVAEALRARVAGRPILVTGGHGGIGAPLARWLAEAGASGLVLAGRT
ncbi:MAG: acyltransferase domain-containing protein, partial [Rhodospirillaceae bacterium]